MKIHLVNPSDTSFGIAKRRWSCSRKDIEPAGRDDRGPEGGVARIHKVDFHGLPSVRPRCALASGSEWLEGRGSSVWPLSAAVEVHCIQPFIICEQIATRVFPS